MLTVLRDEMCKALDKHYRETLGEFAQMMLTEVSSLKKASRELHYLKDKLETMQQALQETREKLEQ